MKCLLIKKNKVIKILEWFLFISFCCVSVYFASGVVKQFMSEKTSFSQHEEKFPYYPVVSILFPFEASKVNLTNVEIKYMPTGYSDYTKLNIGENYFYNSVKNINETVILESLETIETFKEPDNLRVYRIIHKTNIPDTIYNEWPRAYIQVWTNLPYSYNYICFVLTSKKNSPGIIDSSWKDGNPMEFYVPPDTEIQYDIQSQKTVFLEGMGKCQKESYFECIVSQFDEIDFKNCSYKCIPQVFKNIDKNYTTAFCQNNTNNQICILEHMMKQEFRSNCQKSCLEYIEYFGNIVLNMPEPKQRNRTVHSMIYVFNNQDSTIKVYQEYLIYNAIGMIGSVGGTVGNCN